MEIKPQPRVDLWLNYELALLGSTGLARSSAYLQRNTF